MSESMLPRPKIIVVLPAYNAAKTLEKTYRDLPKEQVHKILLVDDVSRDQTVEVARSLGLDVVIHIQNRGYGGNQKTCYLEALKEGADVVVMLHPDHQYDSRKVPELIQPILDGSADMVMGSRIRNGEALEGGMPIWKYVANRFLTTIENLVFGTRLTDCHSGLRAYSRKVLTTIPFLLNSDDFVFDSQIIAQVAYMGFRIDEIDVQARYFREASSVNFRVSTIYGFKTLWVVLEYFLQKMRLVKFPRFDKTLPEVVSKYYHEAIFGG